jgi:putative ABC transport system permease protein
MLHSYLTVAIRNMLRHTTYSVINVLGLAIGMGCCVLMLLFVQRECRVDQFHKEGHRIFKVVQETRGQSSAPFWGWGTPGALGPALRLAFPEIEEVVRIMPWTSQVKSGGRTFQETFCIVDPNLLDVFTFPLIKGDPSRALDQPGAAVITESTAKRHFGDADPIGKVITAQESKFQGDFVVTGILHDLPDHSTIQFDVLITDAHRHPVTRRYWEEWLPGETIRPVEAYILLPEGFDSVVLEEKLADFSAPFLGAKDDARTVFHLQPFHRVYLYSRQDYGMIAYDGIEQVVLLTCMAIATLMIACINFLNLATAQSTGRSKEVGTRKAIGANRRQLIVQFLSESMLIVLIALLVALGLARIFLPTFNDLVGRDLVLDIQSIRMLLPGLLGIALVTGFLAGSYPAFILSGYHPSAALRGIATGTKGPSFRKTLVVFQFAISVFLVSCTLAIDNQISFMLNKDLGFNTERLAILPIFLHDRQAGESKPERLSARYALVKEELERHPNVLNSSAFRKIPVLQEGGISRQIRPEGYTGDPWRIPVNEVDEDFFETFGIDVLAGKHFGRTPYAGLASGFIINETAAEAFGWSDPIGKQIIWPGRGTGRVIGIVRDFHIASLRERIGPVIFLKNSFLFNYVGVRVSSTGLPETMQHLKATWHSLAPDVPFSAFFLDESLKSWSYRDEQRLRRVAGTASAVAILVACLGLFGLVSFSVSQRVKEIGVRKVLGASVTNVVQLLSKDLVKLVAIANLIAWPLVAYVMSDWLQDFAYRISLSASIYAISGLLSLGIALVTVSWHAVRAAHADPVDALKFE